MGVVPGRSTGSLGVREMSPQVRLAAKDERRHIEYMMGPYLAGFGAPPDFAYPNLDAYWNDTSRYPYIIAHGERFVGFALVHRVTNEPTFELVEFYVAAEFRRRGFGRAAAEALFMLHLGAWSIAIRNDNPSGRAFWRPVLARYPVTMAEATQPPGVIYKFEAGK